MCVEGGQCGGKHIAKMTLGSDSCLFLHMRTRVLAVLAWSGVAPLIDQPPVVIGLLPAGFPQQSWALCSAANPAPLAVLLAKSLTIALKAITTLCVLLHHESP